MSAPQVSTVPAVRQRIVDLLTDVSELGDIQVLYGPPRPDSIEQDALWCYAAQVEHSPSAMAGGGNVRRREQATLLWTLGVLVEGEEDQARADDRAMELFGVVERTLAANPRLSRTVDGNDDLPVIASVAMGSWLLEGGHHERGRVAVIDFQIQVQARLA